MPRITCQPTISMAAADASSARPGPDASIGPKKWGSRAYIASATATGSTVRIVAVDRACAVSARTSCRNATWPRTVVDCRERNSARFPPVLSATWIAVTTVPTARLGTRRLNASSV